MSGQRNKAYPINEPGTSTNEVRDNKFETGEQVLWELKDEEVEKYYPGQERDDGWMQLAQRKLNEEWARYESDIERERFARGLPSLASMKVPPARGPMVPPSELDRFKASLLEIEAVLQRGRVKYPDDLWRRQTALEHIRHALNHLDDLLADKGGEDHLAHAACRLLMALERRGGKKDSND